MGVSHSFAWNYVNYANMEGFRRDSHILAVHEHDGDLTTVYWETLTKGKFDEFDESWSNRQTKTIQYFSFNISTFIKLLQFVQNMFLI